MLSLLGFRLTKFVFCCKNILDGILTDWFRFRLHFSAFRKFGVLFMIQGLCLRCDFSGCFDDFVLMRKCLNCISSFYNSLFKAWLFKILSNRCKTELMKRNKLPDTLPIEDYEFLVEKSDDETLIGGAELKEALSSLTPPDAQIIILSVIGGFKSHELAVVFNMPAATVRSRQKRALEKLKVLLS